MSNSTNPVRWFLVCLTVLLLFLSGCDSETGDRDRDSAHRAYEREIHEKSHTNGAIHTEKGYER